MPIIMGAGSGSRWDNYLGIPKQLAPVDGEPILHRTFRLLDERGVKYALTVPKKGYFGSVPCTEIVGSQEAEIDKFLNGEKYTDDGLFIYGDVYWTEAGIDALLENTEKPTFFGRSQPSTLLGRDASREIFAVRLGEFNSAREYRKLFTDGKIPDCGAWGFWRYLEKPRFVEINDFTQDFDRPETYRSFVARKSLQEVKLNIGCGEDYQEGYFNIDISPKVKTDECYDINEGIREEGDTVSEIQAGCVLEQVDDFVKTLNECHRVLKRGGRLIGYVPSTDPNVLHYDPMDKRFFQEDSFRYFVTGDHLFETFGKNYGFIGWDKVETEKRENGIIHFKLTR